MEADELAEVDQQLRVICARRGLAWIVSHVDGLISEGQYIIEQQEYQQHRSTYEFSRYGYRASPGKRPDPAEFRVAPFSPAERTLLLIDAMLAVFADLPDAQSSAVRTLRQGWNERCRWLVTFLLRKMILARRSSLAVTQKATTGP